jgi:hypothetical protein
MQRFDSSLQDVRSGFGCGVTTSWSSRSMFLSNTLHGPLQRAHHQTRFQFRASLPSVVTALLLFVLHAENTPATGGELEAGPFAQEFSLTLDSGHRQEAFGPLFYSEQKESQRQWALPPLVSRTQDTSLDMEEIDVAYPILTYDRFGAEYRFQWFQLLSFSGGKDQRAVPTDRFTLFPILFLQRSTDTNQNYTAVLPIYGTLKHRLMRDRIHFVIFPFYVQTQKQDVVTDNYLYPVVHVRQGNALQGWQVWPFIGHETKGITARTNNIDDVIMVPGHEKNFVLWPIYLSEKTGIGGENPRKFQSVLPLYSMERSPQRDSTTVIWPLFTRTDDRAKNYREWDAPWPLVVFARGGGKTANRVWPLFSHVYNTNLQSDFYLWPLYKYNKFTSEAVVRERSRVFFFLYSDVTEKAPGATNALRRTDLWPLFTARQDREGNERLQLLSILEPLIPNSKSIERDYSPVWSIWRSEKNAKTGTSSQSLLWNLYRSQNTPKGNKFSFLFGLVRYESTGEGTKTRLLYLPPIKGKGPVKTPKKT